MIFALANRGGGTGGDSWDTPQSKFGGKSTVRLEKTLQHFYKRLTPKAPCPGSLHLSELYPIS